MNTRLIDNLKTIRTSKGLTQKDVATHLGVVTSCYANWEQGRTEPDTTTLTALAKYFDVTTDYLLGLEDDFGIKSNEVQSNATSEEEQQLLYDYRSLNSACRKLVKQTIETLKGTNEASTNNKHKYRN